MNKISLSLILLAVALVGCFTPPGGSSAPVNFYRLDYAPQQEGTLAVKNSSKILVKVNSSALIKGPRIIIMDGDYQVDYAESRRWAEPLPAALSRILVVGLRESYATVEGIPVANRFRPDYRVNVTLEKLWGTQRGEVVMSVSWQITDEADTLVAEGRKELRRSWRTGDYRQFAERVSGMMPELVEALDASLSQLDAGKKNS